MIFTKLRELKRRLILDNAELREGKLFFESTDGNELRIDDSRVGYFYVREFSDRFGDSVSVERVKITGCGGYKTTGTYFIVFALDKCLNVEKAISILMYQIKELGFNVKGLGTDPEAIFAIENGEEVKSDLPFNLLKFTIEITELVTDVRGCETLTLCREDCC